MDATQKESSIEDMLLNLTKSIDKFAESTKVPDKNQDIPNSEPAKEQFGDTDTTVVDKEAAKPIVEEPAEIDEIESELTNLGNDIEEYLTKFTQETTENETGDETGNQGVVGDKPVVSNEPDYTNAPKWLNIKWGSPENSILLKNDKTAFTVFKVTGNEGFNVGDAIAFKTKPGKGTALNITNLTTNKPIKTTSLITDYSEPADGTINDIVNKEETPSINVASALRNLGTPIEAATKLEERIKASNITDPDKIANALNMLNKRSGNKIIPNSPTPENIKKAMATATDSISIDIPDGFNTAPDDTLWDKFIIDEFGIPMINMTSPLFTVLRSGGDDQKKAARIIKKSLKKLNLGNFINNPITNIRKLLNAETMPARRLNLRINADQLINNIADVVVSNQSNKTMSTKRAYLEQFYDIIDPRQSPKSYYAFGGKDNELGINEYINSLYDDNGDLSFYILSRKSKPNGTPMETCSIAKPGLFGGSRGIAYTRIGSHMGIFIMTKADIDCLYSVV